MKTEFLIPTQTEQAHLHHTSNLADWEYHFGQIYIAPDAVIENLIATNWSDVVFDNSSANEISLGDGNDNLFLSAGSDIAFGGEGEDTLVLNNEKQHYNIEEFSSSDSAGYRITDTQTNETNDVFDFEFVEFFTDAWTNVSERIGISEWFTQSNFDPDQFDVTSVTDIEALSNAVSEDASIGTLVGITAFAEDLDEADSVTYSLTNDAGGLFAINSNSGVVSVNASLDYETSQQHTITVQALSTDQSTQSSDFTIDILGNVDEHDVAALQILKLLRMLSLRMRLLARLLVSQHLLKIWMKQTVLHTR